MADQELLNPDSLPQFLVDAGLLPAATAAAGDVAVEEITGGNLNFAWRVTWGDHEGAAFVKQAPPFIKCLGPEFALAHERAVLEAAAQREFARLGGADCVPELMHFDEQRCVIVMQDLNDDDHEDLQHELLRERLMCGEASAAVAGRLGAVLAQIHSQSAGDADLEARFGNELLRGITTDYVFTKPLVADDPTNRFDADALGALVAELRADAALADAVNDLRARFAERAGQALVHGDLHTGSVMVDGLGGFKIIDCEFAFYGPAGVDVGFLLAGYAFAWQGRGRAARPQLRGAMEALWDQYAAGVRVGGGATADDVMREAVGFAGCELIRRVIGAAHVADLDGIEDAQERHAAEAATLRMGRACVMAACGGDPRGAFFESLTA